MNNLDQYKRIIGKILPEEEKLNLDWIEVRIENTYYERIHYLNGRLREASTSHYQGVGIRVLKDGKIGFSSSSGLDIDDILEAVRYAKSVAEVNPRKTELVRDVYTGIFEGGKYDIHPSQATYDDKMKVIKAFEEGIKDREKALENALFKPSDHKQESISIRYGSYYGEIYIWNTDGTEVLYKPILIGVAASTILKSDGRYGDAYEVYGGSMGFEKLLNLDNVYELGVRTYSKALEKTVADYVEGGVKKVITGPRMSGVFAHESFGHMSEADHITANASPLRDRIGEELGSEYASIVDDGTPDEGGFYYPVDSEGVKTRRVILLDKGVLKGYLLDRENASILNMELTGNGRAQNYSYPPIVRMRNTFFLPGDWTLDEMIHDIREGVYVDDERGGEVNLDGTFTFTAGRGYIIKNGEFIKPVKDAVLSGNILEMLKYIEGASKEYVIEAVPFGGCGKGGQSVFVGLGGPYLYISKLMVGGR